MFISLSSPTPITYQTAPPKRGSYNTPVRLVNRTITEYLQPALAANGRRKQKGLVPTIVQTSAAVLAYLLDVVTCRTLEYRRAEAAAPAPTPNPLTLPLSPPDAPLTIDEVTRALKSDPEACTFIDRFLGVDQLSTLSTQCQATLDYCKLAWSTEPLTVRWEPAAIPAASPAILRPAAKRMGATAPAKKKKQPPPPSQEEGSSDESGSASSGEEAVTEEEEVVVRPPKRTKSIVAAAAPLSGNISFSCWLGPVPPHPRQRIARP